ADMSDRRGRIDRLETCERELEPAAIDLAPIARRTPAFGLDRGKTIREPERRPRIAAIRHEVEPLRVAHEAAREPHRPQIDLMRGAFVVEAVAGAAESDGVQRARQCGNAVRRG